MEYWRWTEYSWKSEKDWRQATIVTAGIDVGSVSSQAVILADGEIYAYSNLRTGYDSPNSATQAMMSALNGTGIGFEDIKYVIGTGYGRVNVQLANRTLTEISCHARGALFLNSAVRTILDMGGQDCKVIQCDEKGKVVQFLMNDKCAAGTGRGMEVLAELLGIPLTEMGTISLEADKEYPNVSSTCVVFAKSEAIDLLRKGWSKSQVLAAYCAAIAHRVCTLIQRMGIIKEFAITGGIAKNIGVVKRLETELGIEAVTMNPDPQIVGALGAALFARDLWLKSSARV